MNNKIFEYIISITLVISAVFINPLFFQWFWNSAFIDCMNFIFPTISINPIGYWLSFLIFNIISVLINFFKSKSYPQPNNSNFSFAEGLSIFLSREAVLFNSVLICAVLTKIII